MDRTRPLLRLADEKYELPAAVQEALASIPWNVEGYDLFYKWDRGEICLAEISRPIGNWMEQPAVYVENNPGPNGQLAELSTPLAQSWILAAAIAFRDERRREVSGE